MKVSRNKKNTNAVNFFKNPLNIIGLILCVILIPVLIMNLVLMVKSFVNPDSIKEQKKY